MRFVLPMVLLLLGSFPGVQLFGCQQVMRPGEGTDINGDGTVGFSDLERERPVAAGDWRDATDRRDAGERMDDYFDREWQAQNNRDGN